MRGPASLRPISRQSRPGMAAGPGIPRGISGPPANDNRLPPELLLKRALFLAAIALALAAGSMILA